mmetsp:Transcript_27449/g.63718  ORF Transcript_27449/g.63718 Transcript_27449/m.63718 type:complete len:228 (-) Transcript_27449:69-752(-)
MTTMTRTIPLFQCSVPRQPLQESSLSVAFFVIYFVNRFHKSDDEGENHDHDERDAHPIVSLGLLLQLSLIFLVFRNQAQKEERHRTNESTQQGKFPNTSVIPRRDCFRTDIPHDCQRCRNIKRQRSGKVTPSRQHRICRALRTFGAETKVHDTHWQELNCNNELHKHIISHGEPNVGNSDLSVQPENKNDLSQRNEGGQRCAPKVNHSPVGSEKESLVCHNAKPSHN